MKKGKYAKAPSPRRKPLILVLSMVLLLAIGVGATLAYFHLASGPVINTFQAGSAGAEIVEEVSGNTKNAIRVVNIGKSPVYVRLRLVSYYEDAQGNVLPQDSPALSFTEGDKWVALGSYYYYYNEPLAAGATTEDLLKTDLAMVEGQVIEVLADTVQATPAQAVIDAWGVDASAFIGK